MHIVGMQAAEGGEKEKGRDRGHPSSEYTFKTTTTSLGWCSWVRKIPWRRGWQLTPVFLPGKSHGERSLAGYSP